MGPPPPLFLLLLVVVVAAGASNESSSNILKIAREPRTTESPTARVPSTTSKPFVVGNSNPEQDWLNWLLQLAEKEERPRDLDLSFMGEPLNRTGNIVQWLRDVYDPLRWIKIPGKIDDKCRGDMELFVDNLKNGELWAAKCKFYLNLCVCGGKKKRKRKNWL